jgi:hypothetical protein
MPLIEFSRQNEVVEKPEVYHLRQKFKKKYLSSVNQFNKVADNE